jgi:hypothetical protein
LDHLKGENHSKVVREIYDTFKKILKLEDLPNEPTEEIAVVRIIAKLQDHLGILQLTNLRKHYLAEAAKRPG